ncbi:A/G-specific adenine DNA glycosylase [Quillaja saponaria]|uniref:A/G-specific adenine DNA glycosylase n=1 Tax=Quillaja saponaria TaxID=32244 RepID=A0AAD7LPI7_QUISA|nr:A/G-specific adenine DNA glycosylase [Quillaja saponaria]
MIQKKKRDSVIPCIDRIEGSSSSANNSEPREPIIDGEVINGKIGLGVNSNMLSNGELPEKEREVSDGFLNEELTNMDMDIEVSDLLLNEELGAKKIVAEGSRTPEAVSALRKIPGIGDYTAGAIASIAFNEVSCFCDLPYQVVPVVDGNAVKGNC